MLFRSLYDNTYTIRVTLEEKSGSSQCAYLICGNSSYLGCTLYDLGMGLIDYSVKKVDDFGISTLTRRKSRQTIDVDFTFDSPKVNIVNRAVRDVLGQVVLFINDESTTSSYENLLLLGYVESFDTILKNKETTTASLSLMEVI